MKLATIALMLLFLILAALIVTLVVILAGMWGEIGQYQIMVIR